MNTNSLYFDYGKKTGKLLLVPCSFNSRIEGSFKVKVLSTKSIEIKVGQNIEFLLKRDINLQIVNPPLYFSDSVHKRVVGDQIEVQSRTDTSIRFIVERS